MQNKTEQTRTESFINDADILKELETRKDINASELREIMAKSLSIQTLSLSETAALLNAEEPEILEEIKETALKVKKRVYDNRIVTFAPLYMSNYCINNCKYCGFRSENIQVERDVLSREEIRKETEILAGEIGHKRIIAVYGEHPCSGIDYIADTLKTIYSVNTKEGRGQIRRVNVNAAPMPLEELTALKKAGIGTYQVFQETYHRETYENVHPAKTPKGDYSWRLYAMHRAMEAGIDDVGIGVLFGLYDWKFEVMALAAHNMELEATFGIGAHTVSFPRIYPAANTPFSISPPDKVCDRDFEKIMLVLRLAIPHTGMIITAREPAEIRDRSLALGITQTDASTRIGIGGYRTRSEGQDISMQQFTIGDTRSLDDIVRDFTRAGYITSFCTAGYRCGRTGKNIMELLRSGREGKFCKLNAVLTFREWLDDFASQPTREAAQPLLLKEMEEIRTEMPDIFPEFKQYYEKIAGGQRDLYF